jgi:hypothetical protein
VLVRHPRVAVAAVGESGGPRAAVLGPLLPAAPADVPRGAGRRVAGRVLLRDQRRAPVAHPRRGRTRPPTTCTSPCGSSWNSRCCPAISRRPTCRGRGTSGSKRCSG